MDGEAYLNVPLTAMLVHPEYGYFINEYMVALNQTVRLKFGTSVYYETIPDENTAMPNVYQVDYVHIYQQDGVGSFEFTE